MSDLTRLGGLDGHNHLHGLNFDVRMASFDSSSIVLEVTDNLSSYVRDEFRGIKDGRPGCI